MILSSVNLIKKSHCHTNNHNNNHQFSDFILGKIKEDQDKREKKCAGTAPYGSRHGKQIKEGNGPENEITNSSPKTGSVEKGVTSTVTIQTSDQYYFTLRLERDTLFLADTESSCQTCVFRQRLYKDTEQRQLAVFQTLSDSSKYINADGDRKLSISAYAKQPDPENPDERFFVIYRVENGSVFLQPYSHKGYYMHHIDNCLSVRKLEINLRPPEQYFFHVMEAEVPEVVMSSVAKAENLKNLRNELVPSDRRHREKIFTRERTVQKPGLFFGCFGVRSKKSHADKKVKVHR
ncbi:uncharacterized protein LOC110462482 [Mizuhopecten yessoensis]|uniref:uncharacterized protein LOC110462482 n=1 Tax=Mizuhopecten yessoensis TaxID=6573 RepID=UPI000B45F301|nr:uncharacterized protein LOC110462482 [Mizuhopecten yessoensis]